jgi:hypothetical protein
MSGPTPAAKAYRVWQKSLVQDWAPDIDAKLYPGIDLAVAKIVAIAIALHGNYGRNCFPSDGVIGKQVGRDRKTVQRYRKFLIDYKVFGLTGQSRGRVAVLSIGTPLARPVTAQVIEFPVRKAEPTVVNMETVGADPFGEKPSHKSVPAVAVPDDDPLGTPADLDEWTAGYRERRQRREAARVAVGADERPKREYLGDY